MGPLESSLVIDSADVTASNTVDLPKVADCLYVGVSGDVKVLTAKGNAQTYVGLAAGVYHPIKARRVYATGTTATNIVAGYVE